ncbi:hypothetical protein [Alicyclobacillus mengziensis]|nr:hypothetical protein [Alicyclobacillus mengziensis]
MNLKTAPHGFSGIYALLAYKNIATGRDKPVPTGNPPKRHLM